MPISPFQSNALKRPVRGTGRFGRQAYWPLLFGIAATLVLSGCTAKTARQLTNEAQAAIPQTACKRIVSLSPSITEVVYALHLDGQLVGVTRYDRYPPAVRQKASVGGYIDPDKEALIRLHPDLVLLRGEQEALQAQIQELGIPTLSVEHRTVPGILASIPAIGKTCRIEAAADRLAQTLTQRITAIQQQATHTKLHPRVLISIDTQIRDGGVRSIYTAGNDGFYSWLITNAGGQNAIQTIQKGFFLISGESLLRLNPDVIIDLSAANVAQTGTSVSTLPAWQHMTGLKAVQMHHVYALYEDYLTIPGPRLVESLAEFARILHPELPWGKS